MCFCLSSSTFLVDFDDIFDLLAGPGGQDLNQHVVISAGALGTRHDTQTSEYWLWLRQQRIAWRRCPPATSLFSLFDHFMPRWKKTERQMDARGWER